MPGQVKAVIPPEFNKKAVMDTLQAELEKYAPFLKKDFEHLVDYFTGAKPTFTPVIVTKPSEIAIQIRVVGPQEGREKFRWLNEGTKPHVIRAKRAKYLHFRTGYQAGSRPGAVDTHRAGKAEGDWVRKQSVKHPGFPARNWSQLIVDAHQGPFRAWMEAAMRQAAKASNHGVK